MRLNDGVCWEWFAVAHRLRQECVLVGVLFSTFFARILEVALERFSKKADILADLTHSQKRFAMKRHWNMCGVLFP